MNSACRALGADVAVELECTVTAVTPGESGWRVSWNDGGVSGFDAVVLALPAVQAITLCAAVPELAAKVGAATHSPCWAVLARYAAPLPLNFDAAFVTDAVLGWVMRDASRPGRVAGERWVLHANAEWSGRHLLSISKNMTASPEACFVIIYATINRRRCRNRGSGCRGRVPCGHRHDGRA